MHNEGMIYGYARVSTLAQDLASQLAQLKAAGCEKVFREKITGTTADRPQLSKLMAALAPGDVVIIPAVDRLSRHCPRHAARREGLRSLTEPVLDTTGGFAELVLAMLGVAAKLERRRHRRANRTRARRREGEGREIRAQADPHSAPAARSTGARWSGRTTAQHRPRRLDERAGKIGVFIKSFGLFWRADEVEWNPGKGAKGAFRLLGRRGIYLPGLRLADFRHQQGIYIFYGNHGPYYVGLTKKQGLGKRLKDHRTDVHAPNWDRFSLFGFCSVLVGKDDEGLCKLKHMAGFAVGSPTSVLPTLRRSLSEQWG
jgi:hypothetical protein